MKQRITNAFIAGIIALFATVGLVAVPQAPAHAVVDIKKSVTGGFEAAGGSKKASLTDSIKLVVNVLLFIAGTIAVIMIILGGIRYVLSNGDSSQITGAKNTVLYSVIGLVVALLAYAIVNFVVTQFA